MPLCSQIKWLELIFIDFSNLQFFNIGANVVIFSLVQGIKASFMIVEEFNVASHFPIFFLADFGSKDFLNPNSTFSVVT